VLAHQSGRLIRASRRNCIDDLSVILDFCFGGQAALKDWHEMVKASYLVKQARDDTHGSGVASQFGDRQMKSRRGHHRIVHAIARPFVNMQMVSEPRQVLGPRSTRRLCNEARLDELPDHENVPDVFQAQGAYQVPLAGHDYDPVLLDQEPQCLPNGRFRHPVFLD
jgi:hypothetical protein